MSFFSTIAYRIKEILKGMVGARTIEQTLHVAPVISSQMEEAIQIWSDMYKGHAYWVHEPTPENPTRVVSLGLPALIASEKARTALLELESEITTPTVETQVPNPDYTPPTEDEFGNIVPTTSQPENLIEDTPVSDTTRADYLESQYKKLKRQLRKQIEYGIAKGGLVIKPYVIIKEGAKPTNPQNTQEQPNATEVGNQQAQNKNQQTNPDEVVNDKDNTNPFENKQNPGQQNQGVNNLKNNQTQEQQNQVVDPNMPRQAEIDDFATYSQIEFDFIQADCFYPLAFDASGKITEAAFLQTKTEKDTIYRRLEYHKWDNNTITVVNKAFKSTNRDNQGDMSGVDLGSEVPLTEIPEWKDIQENTTIANVDRPLFAYFKMPEANTIDPSSPLGVSGFSRAVQLIKDADMQYSRLLWEYEAGEMAIDIDRDALNFVFGTDRDGKTYERSVMNNLQARLFRKVDLGESNTYQPYAPNLRDVSYIQGLNTVLMRIEDVTGMSRGTLSDAAAEARTATELKILKQRSYQTNADIQQAIEDALKDTVYIMNTYCDLYGIVNDGEYDVNFEWDDSIIVDVDTELAKRITLMQNGLTSKVETRMWYFGETERQAQDALTKVQEEGQQAMEENLAFMGQEEPNNNRFGGGNPMDEEKPKDEKDKEDEEKKGKDEEEKFGGK